MLFSVRSFMAQFLSISKYLSIWCLFSRISETYASSGRTSNSTSDGFRHICTDCMLEAESISILTFPSATGSNGDGLTSIYATAIVTPMVTVYNDGEAETSYKTSVMGEVDTDDPHVIVRSGSIWTEFGVELTSPTTYAAYLDVLVTTASLSAPTAAPQECYIIENNIPFDASRMIIPLSGDEDMTDDSVPFALSQYIASLPQFSSINVGRCNTVGFANFAGEEKQPPVHSGKPIYPRNFGEKVRRQVGTTRSSNGTLSPPIAEAVDDTPTTVALIALSDESSTATTTVLTREIASPALPSTRGTGLSAQIITPSTQSATSPTSRANRAPSNIVRDTVMDLVLETATDAIIVTVTEPRPSTSPVSTPTRTAQSLQSRRPSTRVSAIALVESSSSTRRRNSGSPPTAAPQQNTSRSTRSTSSTSRPNRSTLNTSRPNRSTLNTSPTNNSSRRTRSSTRTTSNRSSTSINAVQSSVTARSSAIAVLAQEFDEVITLDNSQTVDRTISASVQAVTATTALPALVVGTATFTATINRGSTQFIVGPDNTLTPDGVVTLGETVVSLADNPTEPVAIVNGETTTIAEVPALITPPPITVAEEVFTAFVTVSSTFFSFAPTVILTAGGVVTVSETRVSLAADATEIIIGSSTVPLADPSDGIPGSNDINDADADADADADDVDDVDDVDDDAVDNGLFSGAAHKSDLSTNWLIGFTVCAGIVITLTL